MDIKVGDTYIFHSSNGMDYKICVVNINNFRDPSSKYGCDVYDGNGNYAGDVMFLGDDFFGLHRDKIERIDDDE